MMMIFPLYQTNAIILIFIVLHVVHYNNSPRVDMSLYSESHTSSLSLAHQCCSLGITYPQSFFTHQCCLLGITYLQSFSCSLVLFTRNHIPPVFLLLISAVYSESHTSSLSLAHQCCLLRITYLQSFSCSLVLFTRNHIPPVFLLLISAAWLVEKQQIPNVQSFVRPDRDSNTQSTTHQEKALTITPQMRLSK